ncbi:hypothetical protein [Massilia agri]|uniref:hypothetical protein n=1 Tax=Massilia agri TaxID=1886785 RepID=UPI0027D945D2|nr:hypothetical protein [Massilia agri]
MPRKSAAIPAATRTERAKAPVGAAARPAAKAAVKSAAKPANKPAAKTRTSIKTAVKAAAGALAAPAAKRTRKAAQPAATTPAPRDAARPVLVRDSFTMPEQEYAVLAEVKGACLRAGIDVKKSELLRIGVALLGQVDIATLKAVLAALPQLKTGRPPAA